MSKEKSKRTVRITVYKFEGLSEDAKENAFRLYSDYDVQDNWRDITYEDASQIGLKITSSDVERGCKGEFIASAEETAHKIEAEHGEICETYKSAKAYLSERDRVIDSWHKDQDGIFENENELDEKLDELDEEFLKSLLEDYRIILSHELEYLQGREHLTELFAEWEFTKEGRKF